MNPKRDANEKAIFDIIDQMGAQVRRLSGAGLPDLLVGWRGRYYLIEVKGDKGRMEPDQVVFHDEAKRMRLPCHVVTTPTEALEILGVMK